MDDVEFEDFSDMFGSFGKEEKKKGKKNTNMFKDFENIMFEMMGGSDMGMNDFGFGAPSKKKKSKKK